MVKLVVTLLAAFCIVNFADSAAVKSEEFADKLRSIVHDAYPDSPRIQRATESEWDSPKRNCYDDTPCGWSSYNPQTRRTTDFMANTCKCPDETYKCVLTGENVSMPAYVYHCRQNATLNFDDSSPYDMDSSDYVS